MDTHLAYCSACDQEVRIAVKPLPLHGGQANLADDGEIVCLEFGEKCTGQFCPMFGLPSVMMGVRLARSELRSEGWKIVKGLCDGCNQVTEMQLIDRTHAFCTVCHTTNACTIVTAGEDDYMLIGRTAPAPAARPAT
jgi:hypothetical protein